MVRFPLGAIAASAALLSLAPVSAAAQETAVKGAIAFSRFAQGGTGTTVFDDGLLATGFGGHVRWRFGRIVFQPELMVVTRGAEVPDELLDPEADGIDLEQLRLEYLEIPLMLVVPMNVGRFQPYIMGGPMVAVETRCRYVIRSEGLRTNTGCETGPAEAVGRRSADYGLAAGGGISYPIGGGRVLAEARQTWGMRNLRPDSEPELRNRTFMLILGYAMTWDPQAR